MTHNEERSHWLREAGISLGTGILYGMTSVAVGHPFDTIKTKMTAQHGFLESKDNGMFRQMSKVLRAEGLRGLYRGWFPPLWGSGLYRSVQFAVFEGLYTKWGVKGDGTKADVGETWWTTEITGTGGMQRRVPIAAFLASTSRAIIECPVEYGGFFRLADVFV